MGKRQRNRDRANNKRKYANESVREFKKRTVMGFQVHGNNHGRNERND